MDLLTSEMSVEGPLTPLDSKLHEAVERANVCDIFKHLDDGAKVSSIKFIHYIATELLK